MSSFIVSPETINIVVTEYYSIKRTGEIADIKKCQELANRLVKMNYYATYYNDLRERNRDPGLHVFTYRPRTLAEVHKAISCLLYQCSEGDTQESFPEFDQITSLMDDIAREFILKSNDWDVADTWC